MPKITWGIAVGVMALGLTAVQAPNWGFVAHRNINGLALYSLPSELMPFYKSQEAYLRRAAVFPDQRRSRTPGESGRHYCDLDLYLAEYPQLDTLTWAEAQEHIGLPRLMAWGYAPWNLIRLKAALTQAFAQRQPERIIWLSAEVGHYLGDLHVPLHATSNYNGQKTGQTGIHALWESHLVEQFPTPSETVWAGKAQYQENVSTWLWAIARESYRLSDTVLAADRAVRDSLPESQWYQFGQRGNRGVKQWSDRYTQAFYRRTGSLMHARFQASIRAVASFWFTCWVDAGQPQLDIFAKRSWEPEYERYLQQELEQFRIRQLLERNCEGEARLPSSSPHSDLCCHHE